MAMWKKMAEAFGRAMSERAKDTPASKVVAESNTIKDLDKIGYRYQASPEQRAYLEGHEHGGPDNYYAAKERGGDYEQRIDEIEAENSDSRLAEDFDKAFQSNIKRRKEKVRGGFGDESADMFEDQLWNIIDELKANGKSGNEILDMLRVDKPKGPYGE